MPLSPHRSTGPSLSAYLAVALIGMSLFAGAVPTPLLLPTPFSSGLAS